MISLNQIKNWLLKHEWFILILFLVFFLSLPSLFDPHWYGDEGITTTVGDAIRNGRVLYQDIHDNKTPLLYLIAAVSHSLFGLRFALLLTHLAASFLAYKITQKFFGDGWLMRVTVLIYSIFICIPLFEGNIANGENFMIIPTALGVYLFWRNWKLNQKSSKDYLWSGFFFSLAFLFKPPALFDFLATLAFVWINLKFGRREKIIKLVLPTQVRLLLSGFAIPVLISFLYFVSKNALSDYLKAVFFQNAGYLTSWQVSNNLINPIMIRSLILIIIIVLIWKIKKRLSQEIIFLSLWLIMTVFAALLSSRPYPHYLIQILLPLMLTFASLYRSQHWNRWLAGVSLALSLLMVGTNTFWHYETFSYYKNFLDLALRKKNLNDYENYFQGAQRNYSIAQYLKQRSKLQDNIFIWGNEPMIYNLADRLPVGKYTAAYHIKYFHKETQTISELEKVRPKYIVYFKNQAEFESLDQLLYLHYIQVAAFEDAIIFRLINPN